MGKSKVAQAEKPAKLAEVKALSSVKGGAVTKPSQTPKSKSKELAKQVAAKSDEGHKKSKKSKKEPTPEPSSESESDSDEEMSSASSADSDDESEDEAVPIAKTNGTVSNGVAKSAGGDTSDSSESSDDEDEPAVAGAPQGAISANSSDDDSADDSEDDSGDESDVESDDEVVKPDAAPDAQVLKGKLGEVATKDASSAESDSGSDDSSDAESAAGSSSDSDESSEGDEEEEKVEPVPSKKRKADAEPAPVAKKVKAEAPVANGDGGETGNLFVGNLSWNVDEEWLTREFEPFGELKSTRIITDRESGRSKGFGYVEFVNPADGAKAHDAKKGAELDGRTINVDFATAKKEKPAGGFQERSNKYGDQTNEPSTTIFCANLAFGATQDDVSDAFGEHAPVSAVRIPTDRESGQPKGFAYVEFGSIEDAVTAFEGMKGASISGRSIRVDYASSRPRNDDGGRGGRGGFGGGRGRGGFDRGGRGGGRGRGGFDRGGGRGGRGGSTNRGGFGDFKGKKMTF
ncbi:MAG: hypothetical protein LQ337_008069 [Flavoplaca oasis]|nr:MAG: hypothetical protein LQ337_008069 [Flavoplaca oasis]